MVEVRVKFVQPCITILRIQFYIIALKTIKRKELSKLIICHLEIDFTKW